MGRMSGGRGRCIMRRTWTRGGACWGDHFSRCSLAPRRSWSPLPRHHDEIVLGAMRTRRVPIRREHREALLRAKGTDPRKDLVEEGIAIAIIDDGEMVAAARRRFKF